MICRNIDRASEITFPKLDLSLDSWIFVNHGFCEKNQREIERVGERSGENEPKEAMSYV
jgi:hypothetical protein